MSRLVDWIAAWVMSPGCVARSELLLKVVSRGFARGFEVDSNATSRVSSPGISPASILKTSLGRRKAAAWCGSLIVFRRPFSHTAHGHVRTGANPFHVQIIDF